MDQALVPTAPNAALVGSPTLMQGLTRMPLGNQIRLAIGLAVLVAIGLALALWGNQGNYKVLFAGISDKDGGAIVTQLQAMGVPYRFSEGGNAILVPADKVHDARLKLASAGLPKGSVVGYELIDGARFGQTQRGEQINFQRALEGELTRTISAFTAVQAARVHLALPNQNGFFREQQMPSASVMLTMVPGRSLDRSQIAGVRHLVSSSVPELSPKAVSVLDQTGALLSETEDADNASGLDTQQLQFRAQIEKGYSQRILAILEPVVGRDNLRAQVTADVDFSQKQSTSDLYGPNQGKDAEVSVRSQQSVEQSGGATATPSGVPGATSNQPPTPATAPITGASAPLQPAQTPGGSSGGSSQRQAVTNYEVNKTTTVERAATGSVKRLSTAIVVNHRTQTDAKGKTTTVPLSDEEITKLTELAREAVGFKEDRGDTLKLINAPFRVEKVDPVELPMWKQPEILDLLHAALLPASMALIAVLVIFGLVRPALKAASPPPAASGKLLAVADDASPSDAALAAIGANGMPALPAPRANEQLNLARALAKENPAAVAAVVRNWVNGEVS